MTEARPEARVAAFAVAVVVGHHVGVLAEPLGEVGTTRWADWAELVVPFAVLGTAAWALAAGARRPPWALFVVSSIAYAVGAGIHLAANSIANREPSETAHLWDEVVGHYVWFGGLAGVVASLALTLGARTLPRSPWAFAGAAAFGFTAFTNAVEGGTAVMGIVTAVVFVVWGLRRRRESAALLVVAYGISLVGLLAWGAYWGGWPQFTELD